MKSIWKKHGLAKNEIFSPLKSSNHQWFFFRRRQVRVARQSEDGSWFPWHENSAIYRPFRFSLRWRWQRQKMLFINCYIVVYYLVSHMVDATMLRKGWGSGWGDVDVPLPIWLVLHTWSTCLETSDLKEKDEWRSKCRKILGGLQQKS